MTQVETNCYVVDPVIQLEQNRKPDIRFKKSLHITETLDEKAKESDRILSCSLSNHGYPRFVFVVSKAPN